MILTVTFGDFYCVHGAVDSVLLVGSILSPGWVLGLGVILMSFFMISHGFFNVFKALQTTYLCWVIHIFFLACLQFSFIFSVFTGSFNTNYSVFGCVCCMMHVCKLCNLLTVSL